MVTSSYRSSECRKLRAPSAPAAFTLIELLVVISIIALLVGILLPALGSARDMARGAVSLNNMRQIGIALTGYATEFQGFMPMHSSTLSGDKPRWPDHIYPFIQSTKVFRSPNLTPEEAVRMNKPFYHTTTAGGAGPGVTVEYHGGYGYNFQYLGNARFLPTFHAKLERDVTQPVQTVAVGDTNGSPSGPVGEAVYVCDPPLKSARGAHPDGRAYYVSGAEEPSGDASSYVRRSFPAERNSGRAGFTFVDGHGAMMTMAEVDDFNKDGIKDNGYWNGRAQPNVGADVSVTR